MFRTLTLSVALCLGVLGVSAQVAPPAAEDLNSWFKPVMWRSIGPFRGGRSVAVTGVVGDPRTYYTGTTGGGLWKTGNMGLTWQNVSDGYFKTGSVGAVAVAESDPNVVYVGMGSNPDAYDYQDLWRIVRGGAYYVESNQLRASLGIPFAPNGRADYVGFRCAR